MYRYNRVIFLCVYGERPIQHQHPRYTHNNIHRPCTHVLICIYLSDWYIYIQVCMCLLLLQPSM